MNTDLKKIRNDIESKIPDAFDREGMMVPPHYKYPEHAQRQYGARSPFWDSGDGKIYWAMWHIWFNSIPWLERRRYHAKYPPTTEGGDYYGMDAQ